MTGINRSVNMRIAALGASGPSMRCRLTSEQGRALVALLLIPAADPATNGPGAKWSRVMRYAAAHKPVSEPLERFIQRKGGINMCAALGRGAAHDSKHRPIRVSDLEVGSRPKAGQIAHPCAPQGPWVNGQ
jgi:hypothetical protein